MKLGLFPLVIAMVLLVALDGRAQCAVSERPVVEFEAQVKPPDQAIADMLRDHLAASLRARNIDLCAGSVAPRKPVGRVLLVVSRPGNGPVTALIRIGDNITDKRVEREMKLTGIPADARPLAVSAAADELLRASWAELLLDDAPPPAMEPPSAVVSAVNDSVSGLAPEPAHVPAQNSLQLGLLAVGAAHEKLLSIGPDVQVGYWYQERWGVALHGRFAFSTTRSSDHGSIRMQSQGAMLALSHAFWPVGGPATLAVELGFGGHRVDLIADSNDSAIERNRVSDWTIGFLAGPRGIVRAGPVQLTLGAALRYSVRPTSATDAGEIVLSNSGPGGEVSLGALMLL